MRSNFHGQMPAARCTHNVSDVYDDDQTRCLLAWVCTVSEKDELHPERAVGVIFGGGRKIYNAASTSNAKNSKHW